METLLLDRVVRRFNEGLKPELWPSRLRNQCRAVLYQYRLAELYGFNYRAQSSIDNLDLNHEKARVRKLDLKQVQSFGGDDSLDARFRPEVAEFIHNVTPCIIEDLVNQVKPLCVIDITGRTYVVSDQLLVYILRYHLPKARLNFRVVEYKKHYQPSSFAAVALLYLDSKSPFIAAYHQQLCLVPLTIAEASLVTGLKRSTVGRFRMRYSHV